MTDMEKKEIKEKTTKEIENRAEKQQTVVLKEDHEMDFRTKEAYKTLRANLEFAGSDMKVIAITSCTPNEGKSSVSMNLAKSIAETGKKVILIIVIAFFLGMSFPNFLLSMQRINLAKKTDEIIKPFEDAAFEYVLNETTSYVSPSVP